jgi:hypothetical protein
MSDSIIQGITFPYRVDFIPRRCRNTRFVYIADHDFVELRRATRSEVSVLQHEENNKFEIMSMVSHSRPIFRRPYAPRLEELVRQAADCGRTSGLLIVRSQTNPKTCREVGWMTDRDNASTFNAAVREVVAHAGINPEITMSSFRHGGFTECGDAGFTDAEARALSRHRTNTHMPSYIHPTQMQLLNGIEKRLERRTTLKTESKKRVDIPRSSELTKDD